MPDRKIIETLASGSFLAVIAGLITALISKEKIVQKLKNFAATVLSGIMLTWMMRNLTWQPQVKEVFIVVCSAFIGTIWLQIEECLTIGFNILKYVGKKFIEKKVNIDIPDDVIKSNKDV